jgi:hypothetical protein
MCISAARTQVKNTRQIWLLKGRVEEPGLMTKKHNDMQRRVIESIKESIDETTWLDSETNRRILTEEENRCI